MKIDSEKENNQLNGFIDMINSINKISRKKVGFGIGRPRNNNTKLFEISTVALVVGWMPNIICSLTGYELTVGGTVKKLSMEEMDNLYLFISHRNSIGAFVYIPSPFDIGITDGNSHSYYINWNGISSQGVGGHTMPIGLNELINYCDKLIKG